MPINSFLYPATQVASSFEVANSCRFEDDNSDYLNRTPSSSGNRKTWTFSTWIKRSELGRTQNFFSAGSGGNYGRIQFNSNDTIYIAHVDGSSTTTEKSTTQVFRDVSSWYHILWHIDTTQGTASNREKFYINGVQVTDFSTNTIPAQDYQSTINENVAHYIGNQVGAYEKCSCYFAEVVFIDGQALDPTSFGEFDSDSNIWKPIDVSGLTFGTNGFYLDFENSSNLGADVSGNGNNFTVNNLTSIDQSIDTCTNNFATLNPLNPIVHTFSEGNLRLTGTTTNWDSACSTIGASSGKWYFEMKFLALYGGLRRAAIGLVDARDQTLLSTNEFGYIVTGAVGDCVGYNGNGSNNIKKNDSAQYSGTNWNVNDIICMAVDLDNGAVYFRVNGGSWENSGNPESGASKTGAVTITVGETYVFGGTAYGNTTDWQFNFGSPSYSESGGNSDADGHGNFNQSVPSEYFALNTKNLAEYG